MMCAPWYFGPGERHQPNHKGRAALLVKGGFKTLTECYQSKDSDLADILSLEAKGGLVN
jgi:branched-chain amino acid transport system substrate-binding protein